MEKKKKKKCSQDMSYKNDSESEWESLKRCEWRAFESWRPNENKLEAKGWGRNWRNEWENNVKDKWVMHGENKREVSVCVCENRGSSYWKGRTIREESVGERVWRNHWARELKKGRAKTCRVCLAQLELPYEVLSKKSCSKIAGKISSDNILKT